MLNKEIPFLRIGIPICLGIVSGLYFKPGTQFLVISSMVLISGFVISLFFNKGQVNYIYGYTLTFAFVLCGLLLYNNEKENLSDLEPQPGIYTCTLSEYPEEKENSFRLIVRLYSIFRYGTEIPLKGSLLVYSAKDSFIRTFIPGDFIKIRCTPNPIINRGNPYEFDYKFYMENHDIKYFSFAGPGEIIGYSPPLHRKLKHRALIIREKIIGMYKARGITGDRLALVAAITLGQKNMLEPEQKQIFMKAGIMHIMAVSGLHAVILSLFIFNVLFFLKRKLNFLRIIITIILLWAFAFVTGLTPSVLRATIMFSFLQAGNLMKRNVNSINSVLASAVILAVIRPAVLFDAGFLLSYSAVIFIICFYRSFYLKVTLRTWFGDKIWQSAAVTILAQAGTLPLTISLFNRFPTWFILTNIIIVPISSLLIIVGCLVPLTFPVRFISQPLASILNYLTGLTELLTEKASSLPFSTIGNIGMGTLESALFFLFIFILISFFMDRKVWPLFYPVCALLLFISAGTFRNISDRTSGELIIYNTIGSDAIGIRAGKTLNLFSDTALLPPEVIRHCAARGLRLETKILKGNFTGVTAGNKKILICKHLNNILIQQTEPDFIILRGAFPKIEKQISFRKPASSLIITSLVSSYFKLPGSLQNSISDTIHYVKKSGAFRAGL